MRNKLWSVLGERNAGRNGFDETQHETKVRKHFLNTFERQTEKKSLIVTQNIMLHAEQFYGLDFTRL